MLFIYCIILKLTKQLNEELEKKNNELEQRNKDIEEKEQLIKNLKKKIYDANMKSFNRHKFKDEEPTLEQIQKEEKYKFLSRKTKSQSSDALHTGNDSKDKIKPEAFSIYHNKVKKSPLQIKPLITSTSQSSLKIPEYIHIHSLDKKPRCKDDSIKHIKSIAHSLNQYKYLYSSNNNDDNESNQNQSSLPSLQIKSTKRKDKISISKEIEKKQMIKNMSMADDENIDLNKTVKNPLVNKLPPLNRNSSSSDNNNSEENDQKLDDKESKTENESLMNSENEKEETKIEEKQIETENSNSNSESDKDINVDSEVKEERNEELANNENIVNETNKEHDIEEK